jgi:hypothetical protein
MTDIPEHIVERVAASEKIRQMIGKRYGDVVVLSPAQPRVTRSGNKYDRVQVKCDCGKLALLSAERLRWGSIRSCGCARLAAALEASTKHGLKHHPLYKAWVSARHRCHNPKDKSYRNYGGRGITVCPDWLDNPKAFVEWGENNGWRRGLQLDRIDNDKGYCPENCRFVTPSENQNNRSCTAFIEIKGERVPLAVAARRHGIRADTLRSRIKSGWEVEKALSVRCERPLIPLGEEGEQ